MLKINDEIIVEIEKLTFGGSGIARYGEEKFVIFVENVLPKEKVKAKIKSLNKSYAKAELLEIIEKSQNRTKPICPLYNACGSCNFQIADYDYLIKQKTLVLKDIFSDIVDENKINDVIKSPKTLEYRHKIQYPAQQTKNSKRILLGYYKNNSHNLTNIKFCPIQPDIINKISQFIRDNFSFDCMSEKTKKGLLKNVLFRITSDKKSILINFVINVSQKEFKKYEKDFIEFSKNLVNDFSEIKSIFVNFNDKNTNKILSDIDYKILGDDYIIENLEDKKFCIGPSSFFQVNPYSAIEMFNVIKKNIKQNSIILDAYGGVGAIGIFLKEKASKIILVEENSNAIEMAKKNFELNNIKNYEIYEGDAKNHFSDFEKEKRNFDYVILDPPRSGCDIKAIESILKLTKNIIYVSCNPMTLKRDIKILIKKGFKLDYIQGIDMFPYTHHIEAVCLMEKI